MCTSYHHQSHFAAPAETVFDWHNRPYAFEALCPPWMNVRVLERDGGISDGSRVVLEITVGPIKIKWALQHRDLISGVQFRDVQTDGPFKLWNHTHSFVPRPDGCSLEDSIEYSFPLPIPMPLADWLLKKELDRMFNYRESVISGALKINNVTPMNVAVTGSHGLIGSTLVPFLGTCGHKVIRLVRSQPQSNDVLWNPQSRQIDAEKLRDVDAIVHLAGENIASGRWTEAKKLELRKSRIESTRLLCQSIANMRRPPKVLICASAIGYYGDTGSTAVTEDGASGTGFLSELCEEWEAACEPARRRGVRVVNLRLGVVLSPRGGALAMMLLPFVMGAGGIIGSGKQYMSWISVDDAAGIINYALSHEDLSGPVNAVSPNSVTNKEYTKTLGKVLFRPTIVPVPAFAARLVFGQMADELLLASCRVNPSKLQSSGYQFQYASLENALRHLLGKN
jgi:uncharacterized protein (TIGR01777 family)